MFENEGLLYSCCLCLMFIVALATGFHECYCKSHARPTLSVSAVMPSQNFHKTASLSNTSKAEFF